MGRLYVETVNWNTKYSTEIIANITLKNKTDQTFTGYVDIVNGTDGTYTGSGAIHLIMDTAQTPPLHRQSISEVQRALRPFQ